MFNTGHNPSAQQMIARLRSEGAMTIGPPMTPGVDFVIYSTEELRRFLRDLHI